MAKKKKLDDLDAELAALEAELAALEGKSAPAAPAPKPAAPTPEPAPVAPAATDASGEKKRRLPSFGRKKAEPAAPEVALEPVAPAAAPAAAPAPAATPAPAPAAPLPAGDLTHWRQEGDAWVRAIPGFEGPVVRRVLDEEGATVREEPATRADLDEVRGVKAERGVGKLLGGGAMAKFKGFRFGRKGDAE